MDSQCRSQWNGRSGLCLQVGMHAPRSRHRQGRPEYILFQAASEGCVHCVRKLLEKEPKVDPYVLSDTERYSVKDFADYAVERGVAGAVAVQAYLATFWDVAMRKDEPNVDNVDFCSKRGMHLPRSTRRRGRPEYMLFQAASDGCLSCVRRMLEKDPKVDPNVLSGTQNYSVYDFADYAVQQGVDGASEVKAYLDEFWPGISRKADM